MQTVAMDRHLEVTYRHGKPVAAYLYLPRGTGDRAARSERREAGLIIDFSADGKPIGVEVSAPSRFSLDALNRVPESIHASPATISELAPLAA